MSSIKSLCAVKVLKVPNLNTGIDHLMQMSLSKARWDLAGLTGTQLNTSAKEIRAPFFSV